VFIELLPSNGLFRHNNKKLFKQAKYEKLINAIINQHFQTLHFKNPTMMFV
jgi:hypothetical protein